MEWLWLVGRAIFGFYFIMAALNHFTKLEGMKQYAQYKGVAMPALSVIISGLMLLLGGLSILTGYYLGIGVLLLVVFLVIAAFKMHDFWTIDDPMAKAGEMAQFLKNFALAGAALMLLAIPNWSWTF
jgi:putative oxidoreductase